jgi:hypothetical protein
MALNAVSCASRTACTAVGYWDRDSIHVRALVERWNGDAWSIQQIRNLHPGSDALLTGISCISNDTCVATGVATTTNPMIAGWVPIAMGWDDSRWSSERTPQLDSTILGYAVSCVTRSFCSAVGGLVDGEPAAMRWDGTRWSAQRTAFPYPGNPVQLQGVSCVSSSWCAAAGWDDVGACTVDSAYSIAVLGKLEGGRWSLLRNPEISCPGGGRGYDLHAVSCTSTRTCTAVGAAIYRWNGHRWSIEERIPQPERLNGVSCTSITTCIAVGSGPHGALVTRLRGSTWSNVRVPRGRRLDGVSCASPSACVAVGSGSLVESTIHPAAGSN